MKNWVDFKTIKKMVSMENVLIHYGLIGEFKQSGNNLVGCCPIHQGNNPRQFSVNLERNIFNCFGNCKSGGNVLDFVAKMEDISIREAALLLQDWFQIDSSEGSAEQNKSEPGSPALKDQLVRKEKQDQKEKINTPLGFQLKNLKTEHPFFKERGILPATVKYFGLGFCNKGIMKDRIAIPVHDHAGQLVAYCGRTLTDEQVEKEGKYKLPANFVKSAVVYNLHQQKENKDTLVLVESFVSVWKLHQAGFPSVAALMGSSLSKTQERLIFELLGPTGKVILMFDADEDGQKCTLDCLTRLSIKNFVKVIDIRAYGRKPHQLEAEILKQLLVY